MQAELTNKQDVEATIRVTVPSIEVDQAYEQVLRSLSRQVKIPGFRPGKAPRGVLIKRIGEDALDQEVRDALVDANYPKAVEQFGLMPVHAHFHASEPSRGTDYEFEIHMDLYPTITLPELSEIVIDTERKQVTDELVEETVERLQRENATLVPVERPVEPTDYLLIETVGEDEEDGEPETADAPGSTMPLDLETVGDELAEQLLGKGAGDVVELTLAAPESVAQSAEPGDEEEAEAAAAPATRPTLKVRIVDIKAKERPAADDAFATTLGFQSWDEALEQIRQSLQAQLDQESFEEQREEFIEKLLIETEFDVPKSLVSERQRNLLENLDEDLKRRNLTLEGYLASLEKDGKSEEFKQELADSALKGVRRDLVLERLLEERATTVDDEEFAAAIRYMASRRGMDPARFRREQGERWLTNYRFMMTRDKAVRETVSELVGDAPGGSIAGGAAVAEAIEDAVAQLAEADVEAEVEAEVEAGDTEAGMTDASRPDDAAPQGADADASAVTKSDADTEATGRG